MNFNPVIVAQAKAFVNGFRQGRAHMPAIKVHEWSKFMAEVNYELTQSSENKNTKH